MKVILAALVPLLTLSLQRSAFAQGALTPPGAPAPMMKTLAQIEPRTPISSAPFTISAPGSYYLTGNLSVTGGNAISINTNNVTLDLNGFTISSTAASANGSAILINAGTNTPISNLRIFNGHISSGVTNNSGVFNGSGFGNGITSPATATLPVVNGLVRDVSVGGCLNFGINLIGYGTTIEFCTVQGAGHTGLAANNVLHSSAYFCGNYGIAASVLAEGSLGHSVVTGG